MYAWDRIVSKHCKGSSCSHAWRTLALTVASEMGTPPEFDVQSTDEDSLVQSPVLHFLPLGRMRHRIVTRHILNAVGQFQFKLS